MFASMPEHPDITKMERFGFLKEQQKPLLLCQSCYNPIYEGQMYYELNGKNFCEDCVLDSHKTAVPKKRL